MIRFSADICADFQKASSREWLETNGIGGFASATISGANTRRYHGLLTAATRPPLGRVTMLSKFEETLFVNGEAFELSSNQYPNKVYPEGFKYLKNFRLDPFPVWTFAAGGIEIEKKVFMIYGENSTVCRWSVVRHLIQENELQDSSEGRIILELKPLLSFCDYHALQHENAEFNGVYEILENGVSIKPVAEMPALFFNHNAREVEKSGFWYRNFEYAIERERGFDFHEDLFQPLVMKFDLSEPAVVIASTEERDWKFAGNFEETEIKRREKLIQQAEATDDFAKHLVLAADQFIVSRGAGKTIIAGYPWFSDWGRDTMIALGGLTLAANRAEIAKSILLEFSRHISRGMLPNRFPDLGDEAEYNTVDATLWYFEATRAYAEKTGDYDFVRESLYENLADIIEWHLRGTRYNIRVDAADGLLYAGTEGVQLTWMDAKIGDLVITPRVGKPVEIQALWFNALKIMADFAGRFDEAEAKTRYETMSEAARASFNRIFWNEADECLFDVVTSEKRDASVRPNQIFAVSLPHSMIDKERARKIVEKVEAELLTPVGLRSLSPRDAQYCPIYTGTPFARDSAYHQGTVWGWLIGGFVDAYRKVFPDDEKRVGEILEGFKKHLTDTGVGQISEIFDGDAPHNPRGCMAQAWSVAEVLRVLNSK